MPNGNFNSVDFQDLGDARAWAAQHVAQFRALQRESAAIERRLLADVEDQEERIRWLERKVWWFAGFASAVGTGGGFLLSLLLG